MPLSEQRNRDEADFPESTAANDKTVDKSSVKNPQDHTEFMNFDSVKESFAAMNLFGSACEEDYYTTIERGMENDPEHRDKFQDFETAKCISNFFFARHCTFARNSTERLSIQANKP